jgi:DNA-directed RNA polymerase specialized sigma24 family protein
MSDKIMGKLDDRFINRMREWAMATLMPDASNVPSAWPSNGPMGDSAGRNPMKTPRTLGRVHDTGMAIGELPSNQSAAVAQYWLREGLSLRKHGELMDVSDVAFTTWVMDGHEKLKAIFARQSDKWHKDHADGIDHGIGMLMRRLYLKRSAQGA